MVSNPFPRVLLISFFLATLSLAFNPGSKRGHLNRRSPEPFPLSATEQKTTSSTPSFTDFSSRPDLSIGFRRSSSLPNNFSPLSSYKSALDTADWSAGSSAPSSHGSDGAFGTSSYPSVSTTPSDSPRSGSGSAKLADFRSPNNRGEQPLPADGPGAEIKETNPTARNLARKKIRFNMENNKIHELVEEDAPIPANPSRAARVKESISSRFAPVQEKMRKHMLNLQDHIAIATNPELANYRTIGGKPVFLQVQQPGSDKLVIKKAQAAARKFGEARVFHSLKDYKDQSLVVYTGKSSDRSTASRDMFKKYPVPHDKALPLPKAWTIENLQAAILKAETGNLERFYNNVPKRWPTKVRTQVNQLSTRVRTQVNQWPTKVRTEVNQWPTRVRTEVNQWPTKVRTEVNQWPTRVRMEVNQWPTKVRTQANRLTAMVRPVGRNQQQIVQNPVASRWNRLGDRVGSAWGKMQTASSNFGEKVRGLFKGGNPSAVVSDAREVARPIRR